MNNKKLISIFFLFTLLFSNVGLSFNVHYCQGEIDSISLSYQNLSNCSSDHKHSEDSCCLDPEGSSQDDDCCKDDVLTQNQTDNTFTKSYSVEFDSFIQNQNENLLDFVVLNTYKDNAKQLYLYEDSSSTPLFKLYCSYIFYA